MVKAKLRTSQYRPQQRLNIAVLPLRHAGKPVHNHLCLSFRWFPTSDHGPQQPSGLLRSLSSFQRIHQSITAVPQQIILHPIVIAEE